MNLSLRQQENHYPYSTGLRLELPRPLRRQFTEALSRLDPALDQETHPGVLAELAKQLFQNIAASETALVAAITHFTKTPDPSYLLLQNCLELSQLPPTPIDDSLPPLPGWRSAASALLGVLLLSGHEAASFSDEMQGRLAHMIMPAKNSVDSYTRSTKALNFHTEVLDGLFPEEVSSPGQVLAPEVLGLICLRNPYHAGTTLCPLSTVLASLPGPVVEVLLQPIYTISSQSYSERKKVISQVPLLKWLDNGYLGVRYSHHRLVANTSQGQNALNYLKSFLTHCAVIDRVILKPGDLLLINNRSCLHGREGLARSAKFDGRDRWLLRMYGYQARSLAKTNKCRKRPHVMIVK